MSDKVDQKDEKKEEKKPEPASPPPAPAGPKPPVWPKVMTAWIALLGLSLGATLAHALSLTTWLGASTIQISRESRERFSGGALGVGAVVAVATFVMVRKKLGARIAWQKPGQGKWVRVAALVALGTLALFGVTAFYRLPPSTSSWWSDYLWQGDFLTKTITIRPILYPAAAIFVLVMMAMFLLLNQAKWAEFLIETEGELKKVSWPARKEYMGSAAVVVFVVAIISVFLFLVDHGMSWSFIRLKIGF